MAKTKAASKPAAPVPLTVERAPLDQLHLDPANARQHGPRNLDAIAASLSQFGQVSPLVVQQNTGRIIGGNGTYQAMRQLNWPDALVAYVACDDLQATALGIALNRTAELAEWDLPTLSKLLTEIQAQDFDVSAVGFDDAEVARLCSQGLDLSTLERDAEPSEPGATPGDPDGGAVAHIKMVQLFFDADDHGQFIALTDLLAEAHGTTTLTDTVLDAVRRAATQAGLSVA